MCIIINKPEGVIISDEIYSRCFDTNKDGAGFAVCENGKIEIRRGFFKKEDFLAAIKTVGEKRILAHFRWATHGVIAEHNCHPFCFEAGGFGWAVAHNGVLSHRSTKEFSDSACFVVDIIEPILTQWPDFLDNAAAKHLMEAKIGGGNKIVVMRSDGKTWILNEAAGSFDKESGVWYSNDGWKGPRTWTNGTRSFGLGAYSSYNAYDFRRDYDDDGYEGFGVGGQMGTGNGAAPQEKEIEERIVVPFRTAREVALDENSGLSKWPIMLANDFIDEAATYAFLTNTSFDDDDAQQVLSCVWDFWSALCEVYPVAVMVYDEDDKTDWAEWYRKVQPTAHEVLEALEQMEEKRIEKFKEGTSHASK